jgi:type IV pilus assembly protein PilY1
MGQSWSKPTLGYVNWNGKRKLVMIVGGGYDAGGDDGDGLKANGIRTGYAGYETYNYKQETSLNSDGTEKKIGAGIYMFDADTGDLLWNADSTNNPSLKYSVASQIRSVDRNNDGIIDHIYFGDLAGQALESTLK